MNGVKNSRVDVNSYEFDDVFSNVPSKDMVKDSWGEENNQKIQQKPVVSKKIQSNREIYSDNF